MSKIDELKDKHSHTITQELHDDLEQLRQLCELGQFVADYHHKLEWADGFLTVPTYDKLEELIQQIRGQK